jgi:hypothetical protein
MASTLIYGARDAVLVDAFMTVKQANALANWIAAKGKNLTTIYITHGHGDHWFEVGPLLERFPNARAVATPDVVKVMRQNTSPEFLDKVWKAAFPGQIPGQRRQSQDYRRDAAVYPRSRPSGGNDENRSRALRQDAGALSEPGQSWVGPLEFGTRSQVRK